LLTAGDRSRIFSRAQETRQVISINETTVAAQPLGAGGARQRLLTDERVKGTKILLDRLKLKAGATMPFDISAKSLSWVQLLEGEATLKAFYTDRMSNTNSVLLPPGFKSTLTTGNGATLLYAEIPDVARLDPGFPANNPHFMVVDWMREPVFESEHDLRKRISLVTPNICATAALKIDIVIYPAGSMSPSYRHEGADTFIYVMSGRGTAWANEKLLPMQPGDLIYFPDGEQHQLKSASNNEMQFFQFYVPGAFKTVWADENKISAWRSTNRDIRGHETALDERERIAYRYIFGSPFTR
jgi:uncharacterized RmlC-like cupin family protein